MIRSLTTWVLGGALAASLAWNLRPAHEELAVSACGDCSTNLVNCAQAIDSLELTPEQRSGLEKWSSESCSQSAVSSARADELADQMFALFGTPEVDPTRVLALADEISRLRARSLRECVESMLEVRRVLSPEQLDELMFKCCAPKQR